MAKIKVTKIGEGDRERKPSKYGEGGRAVGGMARVHESKGFLSKPTKVAAKVPSEFPRPGGHPEELLAKAAVRGIRVPLAPGAEEGSVGVDLDELFEARKYVLRPTRTRAEKSQSLHAARELSILQAPNAEPEKPEQQKRHPDQLEMFPEPLAVAVTAQAMTPEGAKAQTTATAYTEAQAQAVADVLGAAVVVCNRCPASDVCPKYQAGAACAYTDQFYGLSSRDPNNALPMLESFADAQAMRARRAMFLEQLVTGGQLDPAVTRQIEVAAGAAENVARLKGLFAPPPVPLKTKETFVAQSTGEGGGLLAALMGAALNKVAALPAKETTGETMSIEITRERETEPTL